MDSSLNGTAAATIIVVYAHPRHRPPVVESRIWLCAYLLTSSFPFNIKPFHSFNFTTSKLLPDALSTFSI